MSEASKMRAPNDWQIKKCLVLSGGLLLAVWGLIGLGALGLDIPVLRQAVVFIFLSFVPGLLLLRILRIHNVHIIESLLYSVGLSLAFAMAVGVVANFALPPLGISRPIALLPLLLIITLALLLLCLLAYIRDKDFRPSSQSDNKASESNGQSFRANPAPYLLAILLPLLAILGANLVNAYYNNTLIFALIFVIVIIVGLAAFDKFIHPRVYPLMIFMMALALLYQTTFISDYLVGSDIHLEYYLGNLAINNGYWDATIPIALNSCLSIVILAPIYSLLLNMDMIWLFKIIYPLFFCLVPLALFRIFRLQVKPHYAFFAAFFFISMPMFFMDMAQLIRQQVSELFFVLVILLLVDRKLTLIQRTTLAFIFSLGVAVSHYGMGIAYIVYLGLGSLVFIIIKSRPGRAIWQWAIGKSHALPPDLGSAGALTKKALAIVVGGYLIFTVTFYAISASGASLPYLRLLINIPQAAGHQITQMVQSPPVSEIPPTTEPPNFIQSVTAKFPSLNPLTKEPLAQTALGLDFSTASPEGKVWRIFQYIVELCLVIGFIRLMLRPRTHGFKFKAEYISLVIVSVLALLGIFVLPGYSYGMGTSRVWQITLLLVSPLFLLGGELIVYSIIKLLKMLQKNFASHQPNPDNLAILRLPVLAILIPYFIFNSGAVFELSRSQTTHFIDTPYSIALSSYRVDVSTVFTKQDLVAADWLSKVAEEGRHIYVDYHSSKLLSYGIDATNWLQLELLGMAQVGLPSQVYKLYPEIKELSLPSYIYLRTWNTQKRALTVSTVYAARQSISFDDLPWFRQALEKCSKIYDNGSAQVLFIPRD